MTHAFVTGATGLIGRWLLPELTKRGEVTAVVRRAAERSTELRAWVAAHGGKADALRIINGDLGAPGLGLDERERARIVAQQTDYYALGSVMQFGLDAEIARRTNVGGMAELVNLALSGAPRRFIHVGGFKIAETASNEPYLAERYAPLYRELGAYEASKVEADHLVRDAAARRGLPLVSIHPGGVIGDSRTGETTQFVGFSPLVEALYYGKLPAVPGGARHWLPLVTVDFLAAFIARIAELPESLGASYTLLDDRTPLLIDLVRLVADRLGMVAPHRRIPIGLLSALLRAKLVPGAAASPEELSFIGDQRYDVQSTQQAAARLGLAWPDLVTALERNIDFLVSTRFGARPARPGARLDLVAGSRTYVYGDRSTPDRVMLHGLPLDADSWDAVDAKLPGSSLRADLPGLGRSAPAAATAREWMSSLLAGVAEPPVIVAHSLGTLYAVEYAAAHPERVAGLVLISPFFMQGKPPVFMRAQPIACTAGRALRRKHIEQLVSGDKRARTAVLDGPAADLRRPGAGSRFGRALARAHQMRDELARKLADVAAHVPTVIIHGANDPLIAATGDIRVIELADTGHFPQLDRPDDVAEAIADLVSRATRSSRSAA